MNKTIKIIITIIGIIILNLISTTLLGFINGMTFHESIKFGLGTISLIAALFSITWLSMKLVKWGFENN